MIGANGRREDCNLIAQITVFSPPICTNHYLKVRLVFQKSHSLRPTVIFFHDGNTCHQFLWKLQLIFAIDLHRLSFTFPSSFGTNLLTFLLTLSCCWFFNLFVRSSWKKWIKIEVFGLFSVKSYCKCYKINFIDK